MEEFSFSDSLDNINITDKDFTLHFISLYRAMPILWRVKSNDYMDKNKRSAALKKMTNLLKICRRNITEEEVKKKINILRTGFRREHSKVKKSMLSGCGTDDLYSPSLWYYKELEFLQDQMEGESGISTFTDQEPSSTPSEPSNSRQDNSEQPKKSKKEDLQKDLLLLARDHFKRPENEFEIIAKNWAFKLQRMSTKQRRLAEKFINEILFEGEEGNLHRNSVTVNEQQQSHQHEIPSPSASVPLIPSPHSPIPCDPSPHSPIPYDPSPHSPIPYDPSPHSPIPHDPSPPSPIPSTLSSTSGIHSPVSETSFMPSNPSPIANSQSSDPISILLSPTYHTQSPVPQSRPSIIFLKSPSFQTQSPVPKSRSIISIKSPSCQTQSSVPITRSSIISIKSPTYRTQSPVPRTRSSTLSIKSISQTQPPVLKTPLSIISIQSIPSPISHTQPPLHSSTPDHQSDIEDTSIHTPDSQSTKVSSTAATTAAKFLQNFYSF